MHCDSSILCEHTTRTGNYPSGANRRDKRTIIEPIFLLEELKLQVNRCQNRGNLAS
jgi:hypothetical protein